MDSLGNWDLRLASKVKTVLLNCALNLGGGGKGNVCDNSG